MKLKNLLLICVSLALVLGVIGCARMPTADMERAREAVFKAENDEDAVLYGGNHLAQARDFIRRMEVEADAKRYENAKNYANDAVAAAERAITEGRNTSARARNEDDRAKSEAEAIIAGLKPEIEETERNLNGARYSQLDLDYNALNRDLNTARDSADQAEAAHAQGNYNDALENGRRARSVLGDINGKISNAVVRGKS